MMYFFPVCPKNYYENLIVLCLFFYNIPNKHTSITERCIGYISDEMTIIVQPETQDIK